VVELEAIEVSMKTRSWWGYLGSKQTSWRVVYAGTKVLHPEFGDRIYHTQEQALEAIKESKWNNQ